MTSFLLFIIVFVFLIFVALLIFELNKKDGERVDSIYSFNETVEKVENFLNENNIKIFSEFNHTQEAQKVGLSLDPIKIIVFGNPAVGTYLMQNNSYISIELPLKIMIAKKNGTTFLYYKKPEKLAGIYKLDSKSKEILKNMDNLFNKIKEKVLK